MSKLAPLLALKRALIEAEGFTAKPWFHGTNKDLVLDSRPLWAAEDPMVAGLYTGGGRRAGPGTATSKGRIYPFLAKQDARDTGLVVTANVPRKSDEWLEQLGIGNPTEFKRQVKERADAAISKLSMPESLVPYATDLGEIGAHIASFNPLDYDPKLYAVLDNPAFRDQLVETLGPSSSFIFDHPSSVLKFSASGRKSISPEAVHANVLYAPEGKGALRSVFEFKRGGLV